MKALTRTLALLGCAAALGAALAACDQELRDSGNRVAIQGGGSDSTASWTGTVTGGGWWEKFAGNDEKVDAGTTMRATMTITSVGTAVHETPIIILRNSAAATKNKPDATADDGSVEYAVLRSDAYGWNADGNTNDDLEKLGWTKDTDCTFNADWLKWLKGSTLVVTVKNYGTGKADVLLDFSKDGKTQYVHYKNITVDADELYFNLTFENCNVTFGEAPSDGEDEKNPPSVTPPATEDPTPDDDETTDNTITGSGSVSEPFVLTNKALSETVGGQAGAFDCNKNQSTTTWDAKAKLCWDNPLYGKADLDGVTISFMLNNKTGVSYDSVLTFFPAGGTSWGGVAFTENGTAHAQGHGYWDISLNTRLSVSLEQDPDVAVDNVIPAETWTRVTYVITKTSVIAYISSEKFKEISLTDVDTINYLTATCDKVAVGVGFCPALWPAGYVDPDTYLADIRVYTAALTAEQVAVIK